MTNFFENKDLLQEIDEEKKVFLSPKIYELTRNNNFVENLGKIYGILFNEIGDTLHGPYDSPKINNVDGQIIVLYLIHYFKLIFDNTVTNNRFEPKDDNLDKCINWIRYIHMVVLTLILKNNRLFKNISRHYVIMVISIAYKLIFKDRKFESKSKLKQCFMWDNPSYLMNNSEIESTKTIIDNLTDLFKDNKLNLDVWKTLVDDEIVNNFQGESAKKIFSDTSKTFYETKQNNQFKDRYILYFMAKENQESDHIKQFLLILMTLFHDGQTLYTYNFKDSVISNIGCQKDPIYEYDKFFLPWELLKYKKYNIINSYEKKWNENISVYLKHQYYADKINPESIVLSKNNELTPLLPKNTSYTDIHKKLSSFELIPEILKQLRTDFLILIVSIKYHFQTIKNKQYIVNELKDRKSKAESSANKYNKDINVLLICLGEGSINDLVDDHSQLYYTKFLCMFRYLKKNQWIFIDNTLNYLLRTTIFKHFPNAKNIKKLEHPYYFEFKSNNQIYKYYRGSVKDIENSDINIYQKDNEYIIHIKQKYTSSTETALEYPFHQYPKKFIYNKTTGYIKNIENPKFILASGDFNEFKKIITKIKEIDYWDSKTTKRSNIDDTYVNSKHILWKNDDGNQYILEFVNRDLKIEYKDGQLWFEDYKIILNPVSEMINAWVIKNSFLLEKNGEYYLLLLKITDEFVNKYIQDNSLDDTIKDIKYEFTFIKKKYVFKINYFGLGINVDFDSEELLVYFAYYVLLSDNGRMLNLLGNVIDNPPLTKLGGVVDDDKILLFKNIDSCFKIFDYSPKRSRAITINVFQKSSSEIDIKRDIDIDLGDILRELNQSEVILGLFEMDDITFANDKTVKVCKLVKEMPDFKIDTYQSQIDANIRAINGKYTKLFKSIYFGQPKVKILSSIIEKQIVDSRSGMLKTTYKNVTTRKNVTIRSWDYLFTKDTYINWIIDEKIYEHIYKIIYLKSCIKAFGRINKNTTCGEIVEMSRFINIKNLAISTLDDKRPLYMILFEILFDNIIFQEQYNEFKKIKADIDGKSNKQIYKILMGKGKSSVLTPLLTFNYISENKNVIILMPDHLLKQSKKIFSKYNLIFDKYGIRKIDRSKFYKNVKYETDFKVGDPFAASVYVRRRIETGNLINIPKLNLSPNAPKMLLMTNESIQTFLLNNVESVNPKIIKEYKIGTEYLGEYTLHEEKKIEAKFKYPLENTVIITDEIDTIINPLSSEVNFPLGDKNTISDTHRDFLVDLLIKDDGYHQFDDIQSSRKYVNQLLQESNGKKFYPETWDKFLEFLLNEKFADVTKNVKKLAVLKRIRNTLSICYTMIYRKDYGFGNRIHEDVHKKRPDKFDQIEELGDIGKNNSTAIPYSAVDTPLDGSAFSDIFISYILTLLTYKYQGLNRNQILGLYKSFYLEILSKNENLKEIYFNGTLKNHKILIDNIQHNNKDIKLTNADIESIGNNKQIIIEYLRIFVLDNFLTFFNEQLNTSFLDILTSTFCKLRTGFSGTTNILLPKYIDNTENQFDNDEIGVLEEEDQTCGYNKIKTHIQNGRVKLQYKQTNEFTGIEEHSEDSKELEFAIKFNYDGELKNNEMYKIEDTEIKNLGDFLSDKKYSTLIDTKTFIKNFDTNKSYIIKTIEELTELETILLTNKYSVLIDAGAILKEYDNEKIAEYIGTNLNKNVIYLDKKSQKKIYLDKKHVNYIEGFTTDVFIYYDQKHTIGIDIIQPPIMKGLVTISSFNRLTDVFQSVYRLRKINRGHSVDFLIAKNVNIESDLYNFLEKREEEYKNSMRTRFKIQNIRTNLRIVQKNKTTNLEDAKLYGFYRNTFTNKIFNIEDEVKTVDDLNKEEKIIFWEFLQPEICTNTNEIFAYLCFYLCHYLYKFVRQKNMLNISKITNIDLAKEQESVRQITRQIYENLNETQEIQRHEQYIDIKLTKNLILSDYKDIKYMTRNFSKFIDLLKTYNIYISPFWINQMNKISKFKLTKPHGIKLSNSVILKHDDKYLICTNQERFILTGNFEEISIFTNEVNLQILLCKLITFNVITVKEFACLVGFIEHYDKLTQIVEFIFNFSGINILYSDFFKKIQDDVLGEFKPDLWKSALQIDFPIKFIVDQELKKIQIYIKNIAEIKQNVCYINIDEYNKFFKGSLKEYDYIPVFTGTGKISTQIQNITPKRLTIDNKEYDIYEGNFTKDIFDDADVIQVKS